MSRSVEAREPSRTALLTAVARAVHRDEPPPWIIDDYLAMDLAGPAGEQLKHRLRAEMPRAPLLAFSRWVAARTRFTEDVVARAAAEGIGQYVILGAGLDSFAYRRTDLADRLRVFEVDHPATQRWKRQRLAELGVDIPSSLVFAPVDFERQTLRDGLQVAGFDFGQLAVVSWIGVTMYLTLDAINATLATIATCRAGTRLVLTYNQPEAVLRGITAEVTTAFARIATEMGEPFVTRFLPGEISDLLRGHGFGKLADFGVEQARIAYFHGRADAEIAGAQRLIAATVLVRGHAPRKPLAACGCRARAGSGRTPARRPPLSRRGRFRDFALNGGARRLSGAACASEPARSLAHRTATQEGAVMPVLDRQCPDLRHGGRSDPADRAALRYRRLRWADGAGVRRPP